MPRRRVLMLWAARAAVATYPGANRGYRGMSEAERVKFYVLNGYEWPPKTATRGWPPRPRRETAAYKKSRDEMEAWIRRNLTTYKATFDEWATLAQSRAMPAFTARGFEVLDLSDTALYKELLANYDAHVRDPAAFATLGPEHMTKSSATSNAKFYHQGRLNSRLLEELRPRMEAWAGVPLRNGQAYGVRVYGPGSNLVNHVDRSETHVISAIFHVDRDLDEPWPLEIEDHDGNWNLVDLQPGELCMYESAKMYHARLRPMRGRAYASVFLHWFPAEGWNWTMWDTHVSVPPDFEDKAPRDKQRKAAVAAAGAPPFIRSYVDYWAGLNLAAPPLPRGIEDPVQSFRAEEIEPVSPVDQTRRENGALIRDLANRGGGAKAVAALLDHLGTHAVDLDASDENGWTALHEAARGGDVAVARVLVERGSTPEAKTRAGETPLALAKANHGLQSPVSAYLALAELYTKPLPGPSDEL